VSANAASRALPAERPTWRTVALPKEHGGWGLTAEPALLGLLVATGTAGVCLAAAAMVAFLARTPLRVVLVDRYRNRWLTRSSMALAILAAEVVVLATLVVGAQALARGDFWAPVIVAGPLVLVQLGFEARSKGRRLLPELAGAVGICSVAAMIVIADGGDVRLAAGIWMVMAARAVTSIPHVRNQIARLHGRPEQATVALIADGASLAAALGAVLLCRSLAAGAVAIVAVVAVQRVATRLAVPRPAVLGVRQMAMGFSVVLVTAAGVFAFAR